MQQFNSNNDRITISISSVHHTYHFTIEKWVRRVFKGTAITLALGIFAAICVIYYLKNEIDTTNVQKQALEQRSMTMKEQITWLNKLKSNLENDLADREEQMNSVTDRLSDIERALDVSKSDNNDDNIESRLNTAAIASSVRQVMLTSIPSGSPAGDARRSSPFGMRINPVTGRKEFHRGLDFAVRKLTPLYATADGVVIVTRRMTKASQGSGNFLRLQHAYGFTSSYSHMSKFAVRRGEFVKKGDLVGYSGSTGLSTGPHLHFEIRFLGRALNPLPFVQWSVDNFDHLFQEERGIQWQSLINQVKLRVSNQLQLSSQKGVQLADSSK